MTDPERQRTKPGCPPAIPMELRPKVFSLYREGLGYRAIARELRKDVLCVDWSTIRRLLKTQGAEPGSNVPSRTLSTTILTRHNPVQTGNPTAPGYLGARNRMPLSQEATLMVLKCSNSEDEPRKT
jgi:hypothetical protein